MECNSRPGCPCDFCENARLEIAEERAPGQVLARKKADWLKACEEEEKAAPPRPSRFPL